MILFSTHEWMGAAANFFMYRENCAEYPNMQRFSYLFILLNRIGDQIQLNLIKQLTTKVIIKLTTKVTAESTIN